MSATFTDIIAQESTYLTPAQQYYILELIRALGRTDATKTASPDRAVIYVDGMPVDRTKIEKITALLKGEQGRDPKVW